MKIKMVSNHHPDYIESPPGEKKTGDSGILTESTKKLTESTPQKTPQNPHKTLTYERFFLTWIFQVDWGLGCFFPDWSNSLAVDPGMNQKVRRKKLYFGGISGQLEKLKTTRAWMNKKQRAIQGILYKMKCT